MGRKALSKKGPMTAAQRMRRSRELAATVFMESDDLTGIATGRLCEMLPHHVNRGAEAFVVAINKELLKRARANKASVTKRKGPQMAMPGKYNA